MASKQKTKEYIKIVGTNGKVIKKTIYVDENGVKYIYNQNSFWKLEEFIKGHKTI